MTALAGAPGLTLGQHGTDELADHDDGFAGSGLLVTLDAEYAVTVTLRGYFQPVDGRYRWHGRLGAPLGAEGSLNALVGARHTAALVTEHGTSVCEVYEPDLWGRFKVAGVGRPPFQVDLDLPTD